MNGGPARLPRCTSSVFRPRGRNLGVVNEQSTLHSNDPIASGRKVKYEDVIYWGISCGCDRSVGALQARTVRRKGKTLEGEGSGRRREPTLKRSIPRWLNAPRTLDIFERRALLAPLERNPRIPPVRTRRARSTFVSCARFRARARLRSIQERKSFSPSERCKE